MKEEMSYNFTENWDPEVFADGPRIFVLARSEISNSLEEYSDYFGAEIKPSNKEETKVEQVVEQAGRVCYLSFSNPSGRSTSDYIKNLIQKGHDSVLEHVSWTIVFTGVSRAFTHQLVRHRAGFSYSQLSQQYVDHRRIRFVVPAEILKNPNLQSKWKKVVVAQRTQYADLLRDLSDPISDYSAKEKTRAIRSAARSLLPNCTEAVIAVTANARAWRHFLNVRGSIEGDIEMRRVAASVLVVLEKDAPSLFFDFAIEQHTDGWPIVWKSLPQA